MPGPDSDGDGLVDPCELVLAEAFSPELVVSRGGCNWDESVVPARPGGGYYFAVQRAPGSDRVRIAYLPAYYRDCGWEGPKCLLPLVDCAPHAGDSEALVLEVGYDPATGRWKTERVFLSAHCFGRSDGNCRWYEEDDLAGFEWVDGQGYGAPIVWVAQGRNANYASRSGCERGHFFIDTCERNDARVRFPVVSPRQNIGSRIQPAGGAGGCVGPDPWGSSEDRHLASGRKECFWAAGERFLGWTAGEEDSGSTPYYRYLVEVAGF